MSHDTATTVIYTLSLHDALPICTPTRSTTTTSVTPRAPSPAGCARTSRDRLEGRAGGSPRRAGSSGGPGPRRRSEEHTSELQSLRHLVCRLLLEKKNDDTPKHTE